MGVLKRVVLLMPRTEGELAYGIGMRWMPWLGAITGEFEAGRLASPGGLLMPQTTPFPLQAVFFAQAIRRRLQGNRRLAAQEAKGCDQGLGISAYRMPKEKSEVAKIGIFI